MEPVAPVSTVGLFLPLHDELMGLLRGLGNEDWEKPTVAGAWRVRDVTAHLLDGDVRRLSAHRDGVRVPPPETPIHGYGDLVGYLNRLNAEWVRAAERVSPRLLIEFLALTGPEVAAFFRGLDPDAPALYPVAWAGDEVSPNWFDIGREYTERWHHQQQIREAVGAPGLTARRWLFPVLDLSMRALPFTYRDVGAAVGCVISVVVTGEAGGEWSLVRGTEGWALHAGGSADAAARVTLDPDAAWRLFFKALARDEVARRVAIEGDRRLGEAVLGTLAVMA